VAQIEIKKKNYYGKEKERRTAMMPLVVFSRKRGTDLDLGVVIGTGKEPTESTWSGT